MSHFIEFYLSNIFFAFMFTTFVAVQENIKLKDYFLPNLIIATSWPLFLGFCVYRMFKR